MTITKTSLLLRQAVKDENILFRRIINFYHLLNMSLTVGDFAIFHSTQNKVVKQSAP